MLSFSLKAGQKLSCLTATAPHRRIIPPVERIAGAMRFASMASHDLLDNGLSVNGVVGAKGESRVFRSIHDLLILILDILVFFLPGFSADKINSGGYLLLPG
jgi:hypothetical protein